MIVTKIIPPSPALASYVHHYWIIKTNGMPVSSFIMPMGCMKWMFHRKKTFMVNGNAAENPTSTICGQYDTAIRIQSDEDVEMICVFFQPYASKMIMGVPCQHFMNVNIDFDDLGLIGFKELKHKVEDSVNNETAIQEIEKFVSTQLEKAEKNTHIRPLAYALEKIKHDPYVKVGQLASDTCLSERQFRRVFEENYGLGPKQMMRIERLKIVTEELSKSTITNFDEFIYNLGFTDHSHFNKTFQQMVGMSPTEYKHFILTKKEQEILSAFISYHDQQG